MIDFFGGIATLLGAAKNFFWEAQFVTLAEVLLAWIIKWKWLILFVSSSIFVALSVGNALLIGFIPLTDGEYLFRDVRSSKTYDWKKFPTSKSHKWKKHINTHTVTNGDDKLGSYEVASASVYRHNFKNATGFVEPLDNQFLVLVCRKKGKYDMFLTVEKGYGVPRIGKAWRVFFPQEKKSGVYIQLSGSRNEAVMRLHKHNGDCDDDGYRHNLDVGATVWRNKEGSKVTVGRMMAYYTENSAYLSARYHMYFANSYHFVEGLVHVLQELQNDDLYAEVKATPSSEFSVLQFLFNMVSRVVL